MRARLARRLFAALAWLPGLAFGSCDIPIQVEIDSERITITRPPSGYALVGWVEMDGAEWEVILDGAAVPIWPERWGRVPVSVDASKAERARRIPISHLAGPAERRPKVDLSCVSAGSGAAEQMRRLQSLAADLGNVRAARDAWHLGQIFLKASLELLREGSGNRHAEQWVSGQLLAQALDAQLNKEAAGWAELIATQARAKGDERTVANAALDQARSLRMIDGARALGLLEQSQAIFAKLGDHHQYAVAKQYDCLQQRLLGDVEAAAACYDEVISLQLELGEYAAALAAQLNRATALTRLGRYADAKEQRRKAQEVATRVDNHDLLVGLARQEAQYLTWQGRFDDALALLAEQRRYYDENPDQYWSTATDQLIGSTYRLAGEPARGIEYFRRAEQRVLGTGQVRLRVRIRLALAVALSELGKADEAAAVAEKAIEELPRVGDAGLESVAWLELAEVFHSSGQKSLARQALKQISHDVDKRFKPRLHLLAELVDLELDKAAPDWNAELDSALQSGQLLLALRISTRLAEDLTEAGRPKDALDLASRQLTLMDPVLRSLRSPALRDAISGGLHRLIASIATAATPGEIDPSLGEELRALLWRLADSSYSPVSAHDDDWVLALEQQISAELLQGGRSSEEGDRSLHLALPQPRTGKPVWKHPEVSLPPALKLEAGHMLALPLVGASKMGLLVYEGRRWSWQPVDQEHFVGSRTRLLDLLAGGHSSEDEIEDAAGELGEAIRWTDWLGPSVTQLWIGAHRLLTPAPLELSLPAERRLRIGWVLMPTNIGRETPTALHALGVQGSAESGLPGLTAVRAELKEVVGVWSGLKGSVQETLASRGDLVEALSTPGTLVHLAAHGRASSTRFEASGLWLGSRDGGLDFVSAQRLRALEIRSGLVVLAACETGQGAGQVGVGIGGAASAMVEAGAGAVVGSRWAIGDHAAAQFSGAFHTALAKTPLTPEAALEHAATHVAQRRAFRNPTHWAGWFILFRGVPSSAAP